MRFRRIIPAALFAATLAAQTPAATPVILPVTVVDQLGRSVTRLDPDAFHLYENNIEQKLTVSRVDERPLSLGIILDASASMSGKLQRLPQTVAAFLNSGFISNRDEAFLIELHDRPAIVQAFTNSVQSIQNAVAASEPRGRTALYDGIYLGLAEMKKAANPRKVLLVITDGFDSGSMYNSTEVARLLRETDVQMNAIVIVEGNERDLSAGESLRQLADSTGGRSFITPGVTVKDVATRLGNQLSDPYVLAWSPANQNRDGKFHEITLKLTPPGGEGRLRAFIRSGYVAPAR